MVSFPELALLIPHAERIQAQPEVEGNTARAKAARECEASRVAAGPNRKLEYPFWNFYVGTVRMALAVGGHGGTGQRERSAKARKLASHFPFTLSPSSTSAAFPGARHGGPIRDYFLADGLQWPATDMIGADGWHYQLWASMKR
jgi:hypothetical protein